MARNNTAADSDTAFAISNPYTERTSSTRVKAVNTTTSSASEPTSPARYEPE